MKDRHGPHRTRGQAVVLFALCMVVIIAMAGLLVDGGLAWSNQRQAQAAADTSALTAALAVSEGDAWTLAKSKARDIASDNNFDKDLVGCDGTDQPDKGVVVNRPPVAGANAGDDGFVEVVTTRAMRTAFAGAIGLNCVLVSARAVASIPGSSVASCNFCVLSSAARDHVFLVDSRADVRVDGDVYVNGTSGVVPCDPGDFRVCGDAFDFDGDREGDGHGDGGHDGGDRDHMSAKSISVTGGWETDSRSVVEADRLAAPCPYHLEPDGYADLTPAAVANVCIGVPSMVDPLNDPANRGDIINPPDPSTRVPEADVDGCLAKDGTVLKIPTGTLADPSKLVIDDRGSFTICPGMYYGGVSIGDGSTRVTMLPGVYFIAGGGFSASGGASIDGSAGVMIYNTGEFEAFNSSTSPGQDLVPECDPAASPASPAPSASSASPAPSASPACTVPDATGGSNGLSASADEVFPNTPVTFTFRIEGTTAGPPTGTMTFYDGKDVITGCLDVAVTPGAGQTASATCETSYPSFGTRAISAVYVDSSCRTAATCFGDAVYAPVGAELSPPLLVKARDEGSMQDIDIQTSGRVLLHAPTSGRYSGLLIFQDRSRGVDVLISPGSGLGGCPSNFMTAGSASNPGSVPAPCGDLGGLSGTIYAPHQGSGTNGSSTVDLIGGGLANLQVIAAQVDLNSDGNVRFAYRPEAFANGKIHLVE